jgi:hypothetical protein
MAILNYTTSVDPWKTVHELQQILVKHKVSHFSIRNEGSFPVALAFTIDFNGRPLNYVLPCNFQGVLECLKRDKKVPKNLKNSDQALRVGWRIMKDWVAAQLALVDANLVTIHEVFFKDLVINAQGQTMSQYMLHGDGMKLLNSAE